MYIYNTLIYKIVFFFRSENKPQIISNLFITSCLTVKETVCVFQAARQVKMAIPIHIVILKSFV